MPQAPRKIVSIGLYSSHSPGFSGLPIDSVVAWYSTPMSAMLRAWSGSGAE